MLEKIKIVLIETTHPGNIGAAARAMKTMGLTQLTLVQPKEFPSETAVAMSSHADDILNKAQVVESLPEAIEDCQVIYGTSSRERYLQWPQMSARAAGQQIFKQARDNQIAIVFGNERTGMTNAQLQQCHYHTFIPTQTEYTSLNLAQAVQILCYECHVAYNEAMSVASDVVQSQSEQIADAPVAKTADRLATQEEVAGFYQHLQAALAHIDILHSKQKTSLMMRLQRLFQRAHCTNVEINILRGICKNILRMQAGDRSSEDGGGYLQKIIFSYTFCR